MGDYVLSGARARVREVDMTPWWLLPLPHSHSVRVLLLLMLCCCDSDARSSTTHCTTFAPLFPISAHPAARLHLLHLSTLAAKPAMHGGHRIAISTVIPITGEPVLTWLDLTGVPVGQG
jgi:hypothetical protein